MGKLGARLESILGRRRTPAKQLDAGEQPPTVEQPRPAEREQATPLSARLQQRIQRVAESFLDNERLTADLDDSAAKELLDWGLSLGRRIAQSTAEVEDDEQADEAMYPRLRATRRLMRSVNRWVASEQGRDPEGSSEALNRIIEEAQVIYGKAFTPPSDEQQDRFLRAQSEFLDDPPRLIANLRQLFTDIDGA